MTKLFEPCEFLYRDQAALIRLTDHLAATGTSLVLPRVFTDAATVAALEKSYHGRGHIVRRRRLGCPYIEIPADVDTAEALLNKRLRSDLRRGQRKAEKLGTVRYEMVIPADEAQFIAQFAAFLKIEAAGWKGDSGTALARDGELREFFEAFGSAATGLGVLRFGWMYIDEVPVAAQLAVESGGRFWLLKIGYDAKYSKCSPGQLLMLETLRWAVDRGLKSYELLGNAADWTRRWTTKERETIELAVFTRGFRGKLAQLSWLANKAARRLQTWYDKQGAS